MRTDGALVRVITPVYPKEKIEEAEGRRAVYEGSTPILNEFIPK